MKSLSLLMTWTMLRYLQFCMNSLETLKLLNMTKTCTYISRDHGTIITAKAKQRMQDKSAQQQLLEARLCTQF
jgi:hypothetical protein